MTLSIKTVKNAVKYWWISLLLGILFVLMGGWVLITPLSSYLALAILFSVTFFVSGIFEIIYAISNHNNLEGWGWTLTGGIIYFLIGMLLIPNPALSMGILPYFVGFGVLFYSFMAMGAAFDLKSYGISTWGWLLALAILGALFSFILLWNPVFAGATIVVWTALAFISIGIFRIVLSFKLRRLHKFTKDFQ
ncbi:MAG TPA: DUF308 domain-containing protein [Smithella sp.]|nr:DUF308 domain-containing protein [Smithella sp.]